MTLNDKKMNNKIKGLYMEHNEIVREILNLTGVKRFREEINRIDNTKTLFYIKLHGCYCQKSCTCPTEKLFNPLDDFNYCIKLIDDFNVDVDFDGKLVSISKSKRGGHNLRGCELFETLKDVPLAVCTLLAKAYKDKPYHMH